jgi:hypothetical protein
MKIEVGDVVRVDFNGAQITLAHRAEVRSIPCATGDSWVFQNLDTGAIHYVSEGCTITKKQQP